jgi:hypothetical protein
MTIDVRPRQLCGGLRWRSKSPIRKVYTGVKRVRAQTHKNNGFCVLIVSNIRH